MHSEQKKCIKVEEVVLKKTKLLRQIDNGDLDSSNGPFLAILIVFRSHSLI